MSRKRNDRERAERMLDALSGRPGADPADPELLADPVMKVLAAASAAPPTHAEPPGEQAAMAAFRKHARRRARRAPVARLASLARLASAKIVLLTAAAATAAGGVALASATDTLPFTDGAREPRPQVTSSRTAPSGAGRVRPSGALPPGTAPTSPRALAGLCAAYRANPGKARHDPAFARLVAAAGGAGRVDAYCAGVLGATGPKGTPRRPHPTAPGRPSVKGTGKPTGKPTGGPGTKATRKPDHSASPSQGQGHG